jgi:hypothetical protein
MELAIRGFVAFEQRVDSTRKSFETHAYLIAEKEKRRWVDAMFLA